MSKTTRRINHTASAFRNPVAYGGAVVTVGGASVTWQILKSIGIFGFLCLLPAWWVLKYTFLALVWIVGKVAPVAVARGKDFYYARLVKKGELSQADVAEIQARPRTYWSPEDRQENIRRFGW